MDMWSSDIADISAHKAINNTSSSSSDGHGDGDDDQVLLTGVPLWSDFWTRPATTDALKESQSQAQTQSQQSLPSETLAPEPEEELEELVMISLI